MRLVYLRHFDVSGSTNDEDDSVWLSCLRCTDFGVWLDAPQTLDELEERAYGHFEICPAVRRG